MEQLTIEQIKEKEKDSFNAAIKLLTKAFDVMGAGTNQSIKGVPYVSEWFGTNIIEDGHYKITFE